MLLTVPLTVLLTWSGSAPPGLRTGHHTARDRLATASVEGAVPFQQPRQYPTQGGHVVVTEIGAQLALDTPTGGHGGSAYVVGLGRESETFGTTIGGVGDALDIPQGFHLVDDLDGRLLGHVEQLGQLGEGALVVCEGADDEAEGRAHVGHSGLLDGGAEAVGDDAPCAGEKDGEIWVVHVVLLGLR